MDKQEINEKVSENIAKLILKSGLSKMEVARRAGIAHGTIDKIINNHMNISIQTLCSLAEGLEVGIDDILQGLGPKITRAEVLSTQADKTKSLRIGIMSINNQRITCVKDYSGKIIGKSELEGGLDLAETAGTLLAAINESIQEALQGFEHNQFDLKQSDLKLVTQSFEFEETRSKFLFFIRRYFNDVILMPDWQITHLYTFGRNPGISLVVDKGVSLSYRDKVGIKKLGGWKFPVYDLGGENWLGVETIRHTIDAFEGYIPMTKLAQSVLLKFNGKIEKITEICFKGSKNPDVYCLFSEILLKNYFANEAAAKMIIGSGATAILKMIQRVDAITQQKLKIVINGSLSEVYKEFLDSTRIVDHADDFGKIELLADMTEDYLKNHGIKN